MMDESKEREFTRVRIDVDVEVASAGRVVISSHTKDLSMVGVYVFTTDALPLGSQCRITLFLGGREHGVRVEASGTVARADADGMAVEFAGIEGVDSFNHLRNLVLYNTGDTRRAKRELQEHLGIKRQE